MPAKPAWAAMQGTSRKKAARVCQSRSFRKVIIVGSRKSLLSLRGFLGSDGAKHVAGSSPYHTTVTTRTQ